MEYPRQGELRRRDPLLGGDLLDALDELKIAREVLPLQARVMPADVVGVEVVRRAEPAGQEPSAQRAVGDETDAELADRPQDLVLGVGSRLRSEYPVCRAVIGWTAWARRTVAGAASESPRKRTLPAATSAAMAPTVSSIGVRGSTRC
jgi:hypothetical protein